MNLQTKFKFEQKVKHRLCEFQGFVVGIICRQSGVEYEVLPLTDSEAKWVCPTWIDETYLESMD